jgi:exodeoxyribonuclease-3
MKIIAWNINGLRAIMKGSNLTNLVEEEKPTILCLSETKLNCSINTDELLNNNNLNNYEYRYFSTCSRKGGYSGTAIFSKKEPINVIYGLEYNNNNIDEEGRVITLEFKNFYLIHVYTPNSGLALARLDYRINTWDVAFKKYLAKLQKIKPIIVCGDLNVAHKEIDIHDPKNNKRTAGFTTDERQSFSSLLDTLDLVDTYRHMHPKWQEYSYWSYRMNSRNKNKGWRIDYFLATRKLLPKIKKARILTDQLGSDHAPVKLNLKI